MSRRELREQIFKLLFRIEFNSDEEMKAQCELFFDSPDEVFSPEDEKYIKDKYTDMVEALVADGMADYFKIFVEYHNGSVVPDYLRFEARIHDGYDRLVFLEELEY